eukprot:4299284-Pleurochrysis_carterae.AAC.1
MFMRFGPRVRVTDAPYAAAASSARAHAPLDVPVRRYSAVHAVHACAAPPLRQRSRCARVRRAPPRAGLLLTCAGRAGRHRESASLAGYLQVAQLVMAMRDAAQQAIYNATLAQPSRISAMKRVEPVEEVDFGHESPRDLARRRELLASDVSGRRQRWTELNMSSLDEHGLCGLDAFHRAYKMGERLGAGGFAS